jgi:hypothetical protein
MCGERSPKDASKFTREDSDNLDEKEILLHQNTELRLHHDYQ